MKRIIIALIATVMVVLTGQTAFGGTYKTTCGYNGCRATRTSGSVYCAKHAREKIKKTKSMCSKADCYRSKEKGSNYCEAHTPKKSTTVTTPKKTKSSTSKSSTYKKYTYHDSYDEGWEDIYDNEDYDEERYKWDSDYANGVDDAMDEFDW